MGNDGCRGEGCGEGFAPPSWPVFSSIPSGPCPPAQSHVLPSFSKSRACPVNGDHSSRMEGPRGSPNLPHGGHTLPSVSALFLDGLKPVPDAGAEVGLLRQEGPWGVLCPGPARATGAPEPGESDGQGHMDSQRWQTRRSPAFHPGAHGRHRQGPGFGTEGSAACGGPSVAASGFLLVPRPWQACVFVA